MVNPVMKKYDLPLKSYETTKPCKTGEKVKGNMLFAMNTLCSRLTVKVVVNTPKPKKLIVMSLRSTVETV